MLLTTVPRWVTITQLFQHFGGSTTLATAAFEMGKADGILAKPRPKIGHPVLQSTAQLVREFYLTPEVSQKSPNMKDVMKVSSVNAEGEKVVKHVAMQELLVSRDQLYREFRLQNPCIKISRATFRNLKPLQSKWGKIKGFQQTCQTLTCCVQLLDWIPTREISWKFSFVV